VPRLGVSLKAQIAELARIARVHAGDADPQTGIRADMLALWRGLARDHGCRLSDSELEHALAGDLQLNTQGLIAWLTRIGHGPAQR
jgi:hypothetical protein